MKFLILAMLVVSASAFMNMPGGPQQQQPPNNQVGPKPMPDMNLVMQMVRQILMLLLPKLMANPSLMAAFTGGKPPAPGAGPALPIELFLPKSAAPGPKDPLSPSAPPGGKPSRPMPPAMPANPAGAAAAMAAMNAQPNIFNPPRPGPTAGFGAGGAGGAFMPTGDAFKDMRIADLLRDPELGFATDANVSGYIPPPGSHYGLSLHDRVKDYIQYSIIRRRAPGRPLTAKENDLLHLIGDPPKEMMMPGYGGRFGGAMGAGAPAPPMAGFNPLMG